MTTYRSKTVFINIDETFTDWLRKELNDQLTNRYKAIHLAEDMKVPNITLHRFLHGKEVRGGFYDKAFKYLIKRGS